MLFNKKLTATLLAALILTSATDADAMGWNWRKWALFGAVIAVTHMLAKYATHAMEKEDNTVQDIINDTYCSLADTNFVSMLIEKGLVARNLRVRNKYGQSLLDLAVIHNDIKAIKYLVLNAPYLNNYTESGTLLRQPSYDGKYKSQSALHYAVEGNNIEIAKLLLNDYRAPVNSVNSEGQSCVQLAVKNNNLDMIQLLIDHGASLNKNNLQTITDAGIKVHVLVGQSRLDPEISAGFDECDADQLERYARREIAPENYKNFLERFLENKLNVTAVDAERAQWDQDGRTLTRQLSTPYALAVRDDQCGVCR